MLNNEKIDTIDETNLMHQFNTLHGKELDVLHQSFIESIELIQDPLIYLPYITKHFTASNTFHISQVLFHLTRQYNLEYDNFYTGIFTLINEKNIETYNIEFLSFLKLVLCEEQISLNVITAYIKRIMRVALNVSTQRAYEILHFVYCVMRVYPVCFEMTHSKFYLREVENDKAKREIEMDDCLKYLYELDVLEWGIQPIRNIVQKIRNYKVENSRKVDKRNYLDEGYGKPINKL